MSAIGERIDKYQPALLAIEWAYLARIIDGEGSISIVRRKKAQTHVHYSLVPKVYISNTDETLLAWLAARLDMRMNSQVRRTARYKSPRTEYIVQVAGLHCYNLLLGVLCPSRSDASAPR